MIQQFLIVYLVFAIHEIKVCFLQLLKMYSKREKSGDYQNDTDSCIEHSCGLCRKVLHAISDPKFPIIKEP